MPPLLRLYRSCVHLAWRPVSTRELGPHLERYLYERAAPRLGLAPGEAGAPEPVATGRNTIVRRWPTPRGVFYARAWRWDPLARIAREHQLAGELLGAAGLGVPPLALVDDGFATMRRYRLEIAIERAAPGRPLVELLDDPASAEPALAAFARQLAALHGARPGFRDAAAHAAWGKPWRAENEMADPVAFWLGRLAKLRARLSARLRVLAPADVRAALDGLERRVRALEWTAPALVHGDLAGAHVFWDGAAGLTWIDFGTVHYGHPAMDLAAVRGWLNAGRRARYAAFEQAYAAAGGAAHDPARLDLFEQLRLWEKVASRLQRRERRAGQLDADAYARMAEEQAQLERQIAHVCGLASTHA